MFQATDYDKLQQIMEESSEKRELLTRLLESQRMQISTISHEIRNPLSLVYSSLQLIEKEHPEVVDFRHWNEMRRDIEYMTHLLEELSSFNNSEKLHLTDTAMTSFLRTLVLSFATSLIDTPIEFISRIDPELPVLSIDTVKFRQLLLNLLSNARDALSAPGTSSGHSPTLTFLAEVHQSSLLLTVKDNGCGIAPENLSSVFEPFTTYKQGGTGLGLAIARRVVLAHQGTIQVSSRLGEGTIFTVTLPIQKDPA